MEAHRVQIISRDMIKPSSPTPHNHHHHLKLSYLDQLSPHLYFPAIFFYQAHDQLTASLSTQRLKQSLAHALTSFYPLAGRIDPHNSIVVCNDTAGVEFVHARAHAHLVNDVMQHDELLKHYLPVDPTTGGLCNDTTLLAVQVTFFDCGGISIGMCFSHRVADCASIMSFLDAWTTTCRAENKNQETSISFDLANYFPGRDFSGVEIPKFPMSDKDFRTKRFVFDRVKLAALRQLVTTIEGPTRVELVSAFIWKNFIEATTKSNNINNNNGEKVFAAFHAVNLRTRVNNLENVFGNCIMSALATTASSTGSVEGFQDLVSELRSSIRRINEEYVGKARDGDGYLSDLFEYLSVLQKGELEYCRFSSWCSFPVYEVDFGWGNPVWVGTAGVPLKNVVVLVRSRCGEGIEAWVNMSQHILQLLETKFKHICE